MSLTFSLTGTGNYLSSYCAPSIDLDSNVQYGLGLVGFYSYNALQNIHEGNNKIYYWRNEEDANREDGRPQVVLIPSGAYEITALDEYIAKKLRSADDKEGKEDRAFSLTANTNTLQCVIVSKYTVDFRPKDSIGRMLGFSAKLLRPMVTNESDLDVRISPVTNIRVQCNVTGGAYLNGIPDHTIFEFALDSEPGEQVVKEPSHMLYLPVITRSIRDIVLWLTDQNGKPVNFGNEVVSVRLELKKWA